MRIFKPGLKRNSFISLGLQPYLYGKFLRKKNPSGQTPLGSKMVVLAVVVALLLRLAACSGAETPEHLDVPTPTPGVGLPATLASLPKTKDFYYSRGMGFNHMGSEYAEKLLRDKLSYYNKLIRPVNNLTHPVRVEFGMSMVQLISVNEKDQIMKSNVWLRMQWFDGQLAWDKGDYGGIEAIRLPPDFVWVPDIVLYNNADGKYEVSFKCNVVLDYTGLVLWIPPALYKSSCTIDVEYFPFDEQVCLMKFGSWTFNGDQVELGWYMNKPYID